MRIIKHKPKPIPPTKEFALTEQEALLIRDILGGMNDGEMMKLIEDGRNRGGWSANRVIAGRLKHDLFVELDRNIL